jgi:CheY-like chemotaxis protein
MPLGGLLTIEVDRQEAGEGGSLVPGDYARIVVSDTGHGMDAETLLRAAEPFFSTKELGKGTGLGLSMIHGLAVQLHGTLRLGSEVGKGTMAELWLPAAEEILRPEPPQPTAESTAELASGAAILLVDDDALIAMSTADMLEDLGHRVLQAGSGEAALELLRSEAQIDLLMTDYAMPRMNGGQLAAAARALRPDLPVLLATGYAELPPGSSLALPRIGKPYQQEQLATAIDRLLREAATPKDAA